MVECVSVQTLSFLTCPPRFMPLHGAWRGHQSAAAHPSLSPAAITTSKHLLHLQGQLCCAWRGFSFQVTHTERFAAYVMIGCVKYNAMILGVSVTHNCKINLRNSNKWNVRNFLSFFIESRQKYKISTLSVILPVSSETLVSIENQDNLKSKILRWLADLYSHIRGKNWCVGRFCLQRISRRAGRWAGGWAALWSRAYTASQHSGYPGCKHLWSGRGSAPSQTHAWLKRKRAKAESTNWLPLKKNAPMNDCFGLTGRHKTWNQSTWIPVVF